MSQRFFSYCLSKIKTGWNSLFERPYYIPFISNSNNIYSRSITHNTNPSNLISNTNSNNNVIYLPSSYIEKSYFHYFQLPFQYDIPISQLEEKYKELETDSNDSIHTFKEVIKAYQTLKDPYYRAVYMVKRRGLDPEDFQDIDDSFLNEHLGRLEDIESSNSKEVIEQLLLDVEMELNLRTSFFAKNIQSIVKKNHIIAAIQLPYIYYCQTCIERAKNQLDRLLIV